MENQQCSHCQTNNREDAKFCDNCGSKLILACPACQHPLRPSAKFCDNCGHHIKVVETTPVPPPPVPAVPSSAPFNTAITAERKFVTILFADISGFTALSEQFDPEFVHELINACFNQLVPAVKKYGGTVDKFIGDEIMALFGAPVAHENDPERALHAALEMMRLLTEFNQKQNTDLGLHMGINSGLVIAGNLGSDDKKAYSVMGDAVNLAARLEGASIRGQIFVGQTTYAATKRLFQFETLPPMNLKGKAELVQAYQLMGSQSDLLSAKNEQILHAPLIGRQVEFDQLKGAVNQLYQGQGTAVSIQGQAGLGKSRLITELKTFINQEHAVIKWFETASLSHEETHPYGLFQRLIRQVSGAVVDEPVDSQRQKMADIFSFLSEEEQEVGEHVFTSLFGLPNESNKAPLASGEFKRLLFDITYTLWQKRATQHPTILICDDLQWTDHGSIELLIHLLPLIKNMPFLMVFLFRPEKKRPMAQLQQTLIDAYAEYTQPITLHPLANEARQLLTNNLIGSSDFPPSLYQFIQTKSEGNPLFIEEIVRTLIEESVLYKDQEGEAWKLTVDVSQIIIPDTLQALLVARIDRLPENTRQTLQLASVIGRSFYYRVLETIIRHVLHSDTSPLLSQELLQLCQTDFILEVPSQPELEYMFHHALTQEAAYRTILRRQRREFHAQVGVILERLFPNQLDEHAATLAYHFDQAEKYDQAFHYYILAGDVAERLYVLSEAIAHYQKALALYAKLESADSEQLIHLAQHLGRTQELTADFSAALQTYQIFQDIAEKREDTPLTIAVLIEMSKIYTTMNPEQNPELGRQTSEQALTLAHQSGDQEAECKIHWNLMLLHLYNTSDLAQGIYHGSQALALSRQLNNRQTLAYILNDLSQSYIYAGQIKLAEQTIQEAIGIWQGLDDLASLTNAYIIGHWTSFLYGDFEKSIAQSNDGYQIAKRSGNLWGLASIRFRLGFTLVHMGQLGQAIRKTEEALSQATEVKHMALLVWLNTSLGIIYGWIGEHDKGMDCLQKAVIFATEHYPPWRIFALIGLIRVYALADAFETAQKYSQLATEDKLPFTNRVYTQVLLKLAQIYLALQQKLYEQVLIETAVLLPIIEEAGYKPFALEALFYRGYALLATAHAVEAQQLLLEANRQASAMGEQYWRWQILAVLKASTDDTALAKAWCQDGVGLLQRVSNTLTEPALQKQFLNRPLARFLIDDTFSFLT